ncbi:MAG: choice-of-anchor tandem repeat GloVer-containing protein [Alphaproteobacteria bacterium]
MHNIAESPRMPRGTQLRLLTITAALLAAALFSATAAQAWTYKVIHSFCTKPSCTNGYLPVSRLLLDSAGNLFGTASGGGKVGGGLVFELERDGSRWRYHILHASSDSDDIDSPLIMDVGGNLYGTTVFGGKYHQGSAYELLRPQDGGRWKQQILHHFCAVDFCPDGSQVEGGLTYAGAATGALYDGMSPLFGIAQTGGRSDERGYGTVYELTHKPGSSHWHQKVIYAFCPENNCSSGIHPSRGGLLIDNVGNIFGGAAFGGSANGAGTLFELSPSGKSWTETALYTFCTTLPCSDGAYPYGGLIMDGSGSLLGTTSAGGNDCPNEDGGCGVAFKLVPNGALSTYSLLYTFCALDGCTDGRHPSAGLLRDSSGHLLGMTSEGGDPDALGDEWGSGTVFHLAQGEKVLRSFCRKASCVDGAIPAGGLIPDAAGNLFGVAEYGGKSNAGVVFELSP